VERDFTYLKEKYKLAGAREAFEDICAEVLALEHGAEKTHQIRVAQGDGGIDVLVGDFLHPGHVFQCKYFEKIRKSQQDQIQDSFDRARNNPNFKMNEWTLCVSLNLSENEMIWWSSWKNQQENNNPGITISLLDSRSLIALLKKHKIDARVFDIDSHQIMDQLEKFLNDKELTGMAELLDSERIADSVCKPEQLKQYYKGNNSFFTMLPVICSGEDIPITGASESIRNWLSEGSPVIITGYGCTGKTSLMLRCAVSWVRTGKRAVWLNLDDDISLSPGEITAFYKRLEQIAWDSNGPVLLCLDCPGNNPGLLNKFRERFPGSKDIRLMMAERRNRLDHLAKPSRNMLSGWFDGAKIAVLEGASQRYSFTMKGYSCHSFYETYEHRKAVLKKVLTLHAPDKVDAVDHFLKAFARPTISILELIYRTLFDIQQGSQTTNIRLDWDEWAFLVQDQLGETYPAKDAYPLIAACSKLGIPMNMDLLCRYYNIESRHLEDALLFAKQTQHIEPVIYLQQRRQLKPKHDVIAQLYFLFHPDVSPDNRILAILDVINENELEPLLQEIVTKRRMRHSTQNKPELNYREYLRKLLERHRANTLNLCDNSDNLIRICLGFCWAQPVNSKETLDILNELAPPMGDTQLLENLYTEWGKMLAKKKNHHAAEQYFREVLKYRHNAIHSRTELGKLLVKQSGHEEEAEQLFRKAIELDNRQIHPRTELGKLLADRPGCEGEAEKLFLKAIELDNRQIHPRTELGKLLAKRPGCEGEAEKLFRKAIELDNRQLQPRTELAKLYSLLGKDDEAEKILKEIIDIDKDNVHARTELGILYSRLGKDDKAETVLKKILDIEAENLHARSELAKLYEKRGDIDKAEALYQQIQKFDSKNKYAKQGLAHLARKK
jgi:Flp pilus assembly protein TadD